MSLGLYILKASINELIIPWYWVGNSLIDTGGFNMSSPVLLFCGPYEEAITHSD